LIPSSTDNILDMLNEIKYLSVYTF
jgi:hypothetical protein